MARKKKSEVAESIINGTYGQNQQTQPRYSVADSIINGTYKPNSVADDIINGTFNPTTYGNKTTIEQPQIVEQTVEQPQIGNFNQDQVNDIKNIITNKTQGLMNLTKPKTDNSFGFSIDNPYPRTPEEEQLLKNKELYGNRTDVSGYTSGRTGMSKEIEPTTFDKLDYVKQNLGMGLASGVVNMLDAPVQYVQEGAERGKNMSFYDVNFAPDNKYLRAVDTLQDENMSNGGKILDFFLEMFTGTGEIKNLFTDFGEKLGYSNNEVPEAIQNIRNTVRQPLEEKQQELNEKGQKLGGGWQTAGEVANSVGNMIPSIAASAITGNPNIGLAVMGTSAKGGSTYEAEQKGATLREANAIGLAKGGVEVGTEKLTGGIDYFGKGQLDDIAEKGINKLFKGKVSNFIAKKGMDIAGEELEEVTSDLVDFAIDKATTDPDAEYTWDNLSNTLLITALTTGTINATSGGYSKSAYQLNVQELQEVLKNEKIQKEVDAKVEQFKTPDMNKEQVEELRKNVEAIVLGDVQNNINKAMEKGIQQVETQQTQEQPTTTPLNEVNQGVLQENNQTPYQAQTPQITPLNEVNQELQQVRQNDIANQVQAMNLEQEPQFTQKQGNYVYEKSDNSKIDNLRKDAANYLKAGEQTDNFVKTMEKIIADKDIEIRFDSKLGNNVNGTYKNGVITINPNSNRAGEFVAIHELTHAIGTQPMIDMIQTYRKSNAEFNNAVERLLSTYKTTEINEEALGDIAGQLFGNQEYINNLSMENPSLFKRIYNEIKYLWHQFRGYKNQNQFIEDLRNKWESAYRNNVAKQTSKTGYSLEERVSGDKLLDTQDLIDEIKDVGAEVDDNGYVTVYHQTTDENAQKIRETGQMISKEPSVFFSTSKNASQSDGRGTTKLEFKIPAEELELDDLFSDNADVKIRLNGKNSLDVSNYLVNNNQNNKELDNSSFIIEKNEDVNKLELPKSPYQTLRPNVRGGWNIDKIQKQLKNESSNRVNSKELSKFDNLDDLMNNIYYHGSISAHDNLKAGSTLQENQRTGGYGEEYHSISLSGNKNIASNFASMGQNGTVMPVILKKNANVIEMPNIEDSIELEDILPELWNKGVDAVKIGDWDIETKGYGEQELVILNPRAIMTMPQGTTYFQNYHKPKFQNMTKEEILETLTKTKERALNDPKLKPGQAEEIESRYDKLIKYSKDNQTWREYLEKEFPSQGTRTNLQDINERNKPKQENKTTQEEKPQEMPKNEVKQEVKKSYLTSAEQNELDGLKSVENSGFAELTPQEQARMEELEKKSQGITKKFPELKKTVTQEDTKPLYFKYKDSEISRENNKILNQAKKLVESNTQGRRTKQQWLQIAEYIGANADIKSSTDLQQLAMETWLASKPNTKDNLNRQGNKYVDFKTNEWFNAMYKGAGVGTDVKLSVEEATDNKGKKVDLKPTGNNTYEEINVKPKKNEIVPDMSNKVLNIGDEKVSNFYSNITEKSKFITEENRESLKDNANLKYYDAITNKETLENAMDKLNKNAEQQVGEFFAKKDFTAEDVATGWILVKRYQDAGNYEAMTNVIEKMREQGTKAGQTVQAYGILQRLTPEGMEYYSQKQLDKAFNEFSKNKSKKQIEKYANDFTLTAEEHQFIKDTMEKVETLDNDDAKKVEIAKIVQMLSDKMPPQKGAGLKAWMRISMLGNPKTQVRNIMGNAIIQPVNWVGDIFSATADKIMSKKTGQRTIGTTSFKALRKGRNQGFKEAVRDAKIGIDTRDINLNRFEENIGSKPFYEGHKSKILNKGAKVLNKTNKLLSNIMSGGDRIFYQAIYENSLQNQMKLNNTNTPTQEMMEIAEQEALSRTWNDNNAYTKAVLQIRNAMNKLNFKGYGLGDVLVPFAKTPANLTKAIVDYSPVGLVRTIVQDGKNYKNSLENGQYNAQLQHKFADSLGKGFAGSLLYMAAFALAKAGIITGKSDDDKDVANFLRNTLGIQPYSVKIGDMSFTYDWAQPLAAPFSIAADITQSMEKGDGDVLSLLSSGGNSALNILLDQSFLSSIQEVFNSYNGPGEAIENQISGLPARATPTFFKQIADLLDSKSRQTFIKDDKLETVKNQVQQKIPIASQDLVANRDTLGREIEKYGGNDNPLEYAFNVFLNPANTNKGKPSEAAKEIYEVYKATGEKSVMPRQVGYSESVGGSTKNLTAQERNEWQKKSGEMVEENVKALVNSNEYKKLSSEDKAEVITGIVNFSFNKAKSELFDVPMANTYSAANKQVENGVPLYDYYIKKVSKAK